MKKLSDDAAKASRRNFTKAVATAFVATPFATLEASAQRRARGNTPPTVQRPTVPIEPTEGGQRLFHEHTPPMIIESGSLFVESLELTHGNKPGKRPHAYKHPRGILYRVSLTVITEGGTVQPYGYWLSGPKWEIRIWLEEERGGNYVLIHEAEPQLLLYTDSGGGSGPHLTLETDREIKHVKDTNVPDHPKRYEHQAVYVPNAPYQYTPNSHYQIGKVEIAQNISGGETISPSFFEGRKKVYILPYFRRRPS